MYNISILNFFTLLCIYCSYEDHSEKTEEEDKEKEKEKNKTSKKEK
jgi:hypothetical protein